MESSLLNQEFKEGEKQQSFIIPYFVGDVLDEQLLALLKFMLKWYSIQNLVSIKHSPPVD